MQHRNIVQHDHAIVAMFSLCFPTVFIHSTGLFRNLQSIFITKHKHELKSPSFCEFLHFFFSFRICMPRCLLGFFFFFFWTEQIWFLLFFVFCLFDSHSCSFQTFSFLTTRWKAQCNYLNRCSCYGFEEHRGITTSLLFFARFQTLRSSFLFIGWHQNTWHRKSFWETAVRWSKERV